MKRPHDIAFCLLLLTACGRPSRPTAPPDSPAAERHFVLPTVPMTVPEEGRYDYLREHFWDHFDFRDTTFVQAVDTMEMMEAFGQYVYLLSNEPMDDTPMRRLMHRAAESRTMLDYFAMLAEGVLDDPNSPLRNAELYLPVLEEQLAATWYDEAERELFAYNRRIAMQNRVGAPANDFQYTLASGARGRLYNLHSEYILLFINNPGCNMCREIREAICASPMLGEMIERGRMQVLAIYPDEDLTEWHAYRGEIPPKWINAYDAGCHLRNDDLYDLRAIPALYLLDDAKRVLARDVTEVAIIEEIIDRRS